MGNSKSGAKGAYVVGLDIGYGSLTVVHGFVESDQPVVVTMPVGAVPASEAYLEGVEEPPEGSRFVQIGDKNWVAGIRPSDLPRYRRQMNSGYTSTDAYLALFYAALSESHSDTIDVLVTGLPVNLFIERREEVEKLMTGEHKISDKRTVRVNKVLVQRQPAGAYYHTLDQSDESTYDLLRRSSVLVCDGGYFSFDYTLFVSGRLDPGSAGHNDDAMGRVLKRASELFNQAEGRTVSADRLEAAMIGFIESFNRIGKSPLSMEDADWEKISAPVIAGPKEINAAPYIIQAGHELGLKAIGAAVNAAGLVDIDHVFLAGGTSILYAKAAKAVLHETHTGAAVFLVPFGIQAVAMGFHAQALAFASE